MKATYSVFLERLDKIGVPTPLGIHHVESKEEVNTIIAEVIKDGVSEQPIIAGSKSLKQVRVYRTVDEESTEVARWVNIDKNKRYRI